MNRNPTNFLKAEAAGNDFLLIESAPAVDASWIAKACDRHTGAGADGVIFVWRDGGQWRWRFFNGDGSETDLCGNAARCVGRYLQGKEPAAKQWSWSGSLGAFVAKPEADGRIAVTWPSQKIERREIPDDLMQWTMGFNDHGLAALHWWQVGVPHVVLLNHEVWNLAQRLPVNPVMRAYPSLGPEGANVTWVSLKTLDTVTFERGVERETLACGSGAVAAFLSYQEFSKENGRPTVSSATLNFPGGPLEVRRDPDGRLWLSGSARIVFKGEFLG